MEVPDLTLDLPINYVACTYRDHRAGRISRDAAKLIIRSHIPLPDDALSRLLDAEPDSVELARALCDRTGWDHHDQTDDNPCTACRADAAVVTTAVRSDAGGARQLTDDADWEAIAAWCGGTLHNHRDPSDEYSTELRINSGGRAWSGREGDWVVPVDGGFRIDSAPAGQVRRHERPRLDGEPT